MKKRAIDCALGTIVRCSNVGADGTVIGRDSQVAHQVLVGYTTKPEPYGWPLGAGICYADILQADAKEQFSYGWWIPNDEEVEVIWEPYADPKTNPIPPPAKSEQLELPKTAHCSCASWSKYTGLRHECANCRGTSSLDRRLAAASRLEEIGIILTNYGELTAAAEAMDLAAIIRTGGFE